jgi:hypothetical protein
MGTVTHGGLNSETMHFYEILKDPQDSGPAPLEAKQRQVALAFPN